MFKLLILTVLAGVAFGQSPDFLYGIKVPAVTVATLPAAASNTDRMYAVTDGLTASDCLTGGGSTRAFCRSTGSAWTSLGSGAVTSFISRTGAVVAVQDDYSPVLFNCLTVSRATTILTVGTNLSASNICNISVNGTIYPFTASFTITISAGTPTVRIFVSDGSDGAAAGTVIVRNSAASGVACSAGCTVQNSLSAFPTTGGVVPIAQWSAASAVVWDTTGIDYRPFLGGGKRIIAGFATTAVESTSGTTVAVDLTQLETAQGNWYPLGHAYDVANHAKPATSLQLSCAVTAVPLTTASTFTYAFFYATTLDVGTYGAWNIYDVSSNPTRLGPATTAAALLTTTGTKNSTMGPLALLPGDYTICYVANSANVADYLSVFATTSYLQSTTPAQFTCATAATLSTSTFTWPLNCGAKTAQGAGTVFPIVRFVSAL